MSLRTPLGSVLGLGSAKEGTGHFWGQRLSGMALAILGCLFVCALALAPEFSHVAVLAEIARPVNGVLLLLLSVTMAYHSSLGVQVVVEDYVHSHGLKLAILIFSRFSHTLFAVAAVYAIIKIGLNA
jgi:succinate dehydrogenase / fumarate reductase membrane anchor subunit